MHKVVLLTTMWVLGLAAIAAFAWLVEWSNDTPVRVPAAAEVPAPGSAEQPLAALTAGAARSAGTATAALADGDRSAATHATDSALRATEVGHQASHGQVEKAFAGALHDVHVARERFHGGDAAGARVALDRAVDRLEQAVGPARDTSVGVPPPAVRHGYRGAMLLNANGSMVGSVERLGHGRERPTARLRLGGARNVLGVGHLGGESVTVPADRLLWGPRRSLGSVLVVVPTEGHRPGAISATFSSR